jgi:PAS domain S-box-containing protein
MLEAVRKMESSADNTRYFLINESGQQLVTSRPDPGHYSGEGSDFTFSALHPVVWRKLDSGTSGSIELPDGLWIWEKFAPAAMLKATGLAMDDLESSRIHAEDLSLALLAHKPMDTILALRQQQRFPVIFGALVILAVYALALFVFLRGLIIEQRAKIKESYATAQAAQAARVRELQERYRQLVETSCIGQIVIDDAGRIVMSNPAADAMLGYQDGELNHRPVDQLVPPESHDQHVRWREDYLVAPISRKMGEGRELTAVTKDGKRIPVEVGLNPYVEDGRKFVLASIIDLSKRFARASKVQPS